MPGIILAVFRFACFREGALCLRIVINYHNDDNLLMMMMMRRRIVLMYLLCHCHYVPISPSYSKNIK